MAEHNIKATLIQKCKTASDWATDDNKVYVPKKGEIIIYSDLKKIKVGDGMNYVADLDFIDKEIIVDNGRLILDKQIIQIGHTGAVIINETDTGTEQGVWFKDSLNVADGVTTSLHGPTDISGILTVSGNSEFDNPVTVNSTLETSGKITAKGDVEIQGDLSVSDAATLANGLTVSNGDTSLKNATVNGTLEVKNTLTVNNNAEAKFTGPVTANGNLSVGGNLSVNGVTDVGVINAVGKMTAKQGAEVQNGFVSSGDTSLQQTTINKSLSANSTAVFNGETTVNNNFKVDSDYTTTLGGDVKIGGNLTTSQDSSTTSQNTVAFGKSNTAGSKGYRYTSRTNSDGGTILIVDDALEGVDYLESTISVITNSDTMEIPATKVTISPNPEVGQTTFIFDKSIVLPSDPSAGWESDAPYKMTIRIDKDPQKGDTEIGMGAVAMGVKNQALGYNSFAAGRGNVSFSAYAFTEGRDNKAYFAAHAEGRGNKALGDASHAEGYNTEAQAHYSHAEGAWTRAKQEADHAEGIRTIANGGYSHAEGNGSTANGKESHAEGHNTWTGTIPASLPVAGDEKEYNRGIYAHAEGNASIATGHTSHAEGYRVIANGHHSHAEGDVATAKTDITKKITHIIKGQAKDFNMSTAATGTDAHFSHREGRNTMTCGTGSHVEGVGNIAYGKSTHAEGYLNIAVGNNSHVGGKYCRTDGNSSLAFGIGVTTTADAQTVVGKHNASSDALFIVGAGEGPSTDTEWLGDEVASKGTTESIILDRNAAKKPTKARNAFTAGYNDTDKCYITIGEHKLTESQLGKILAFINSLEADQPEFEPAHNNEPQEEQ